MHHILEFDFEAKINASLNTIKQRKRNSSILNFGVPLGVANQMSGMSSATVETPLALPLFLYVKPCSAFMI